MRVVLSTFGTIGDLVPFQRLASALVARGHEVTFHTWEQFRAWVPDGARYEPAAGGVTADELAEYMARALRAPLTGTILDQIRCFAKMFYGLGDGADRARAAYERATQVFAGHDVAMVSFLDHLGQLAADELRVPWLCYRSHPLGDTALADRVFAGIDDELRRLIREATGIDRRIRAWREDSAIATLVASSPWLAEPARASNVIVTGAWLAKVAPAAEVPSDLEAFLAAGPALLATFGIMPDVTHRTAALLDAIERSGWRAIVQVLPPAAPPTHVPDGVYLARTRLPFAELFPRVAAVVHHASVGTLHEVVRAARPHFCLPHMGDQFFWSDTLAARGLGPPPVPYMALDPQVLAERLTALRSPAYSARAAELAPRIAAEDGVAIAVRHIEARR